MKRILILLTLATAIALPIYWTYSYTQSDDFKNQIRDYLESATGYPMDYESLDFQFTMKPKVILSNLRIPASSNQNSQAFLEVDEAILGLNMAGLLVGSNIIPVDPVIFHGSRLTLLRGKDRFWNYQRERFAEATQLEEPLFAEESKTGFLNPKKWKYPTRKIQFDQSTIDYADRSEDPIFGFRLENVAGMAHHRTKGSVWQIRGGAALRKPFHDDVIIQGLFDEQGRGQWEINFKQFPIALKIDMAKMGDRWEWRANGQVQGLDLTNVLYFGEGQMQPIHGRLTARFESVGEGPPRGKFWLKRPLKGAFDIRRGELKTGNLLRQLLGPLLKSPQEGSKLGQNGLSEGLRRLYEQEGTPFDFLQAQVRMQQKRLFLEDIRIKHGQYFLEADGSIGLINQEVDLRAKLVLMEDFSQELVENYPDLEVLKNEVGRIVVPFFYRGLWPDRATAYPDQGFLNRFELSVNPSKNKDNPIDLMEIKQPISDEQVRRQEVMEEELTNLEQELKGETL